MTVDTCRIPLQEDGSGVIRVENTRVTLDSILFAFQDGASAEEIADRFPTVSLSAVYAAIAFYLQNRSDLDSYLMRRSDERERLRKTLEARPDAMEFRARLLARKSANGLS